MLTLCRDSVHRRKPIPDRCLLTADHRWNTDPEALERLGDGLITLAGVRSYLALPIAVGRWHVLRQISAVCDI
jgi:hypothetical protein